LPRSPVFIEMPEYFEKIHKIVGLEGGTLERFMCPGT
jgi:hypothetical protein